MSSSSMEERLRKLKELQKKKVDGAKHNKDELFKEYRIQKIGQNKLRSLEDKKEKAQEELDKLDSMANGQDWERKKAWDYSMEDHEKWDAKLERKQGNKSNAGFVNYSQLAEQTYKKEILGLKLDKDKLKDKQSGNEVDYNNKPTKKDLDRLLSGIKGSDIRKSKRRNDHGNTNNYINEKNKHFNDKLNRHYGKNNE